MFDNKFDQYTNKVCPEIEYIFRTYTIVDIFSYFRTFENILLNAPLLDQSWKTKICKSEEIRGGAFSILHKLLHFEFQIEIRFSCLSFFI